MSELYDKIGMNYDSTRCADPFITSNLAKILDVSSNSNILDIACGTGNYTIALNDMCLNMTGIDISEDMLYKAKEKRQNINWIRNDASCMSMDDASFDGAICTLACHHFKDRRSVFSEVYRVLQKGKFVIFTCDHIQIRNYWLYKFYPEVLEYMISYMPSVYTLLDELCSVGFRLSSIVPYFVSETLKDNFLGARIEQPWLYLNDSFRSGMSIFAEKASSDMIERGCVRLKDDISSGTINSYLEKYYNNYGDYLFLTVEKC